MEARERGAALDEARAALGGLHAAHEARAAAAGAATAGQALAAAAAALGAAAEEGGPLGGGGAATALGRLAAADGFVRPVLAALPQGPVDTRCGCHGLWAGGMTCRDSAAEGSPPPLEAAARWPLLSTPSFPPSAPPSLLPTPGSSCWLPSRR